ncbi:MAG: flagellar filament capping protein FliD, partial [Limisphaerales bacterium]
TDTSLGSFNFSVSQLATASSWRGAADIGARLSESDDVSGVVLGATGLGTAFRPGTFTVNNQQITVEATDNLQAVFDRIASTTGVTASYSSATDKVTLSGPGTITLGSAADTSNMLQLLKLSNTGTSSTSSGSALGAVNTSAALSAANLATAISDGGSSAGEFKLNGVSITYNASSDSLGAVLNRINSSAAGVTATYDSALDRVVLMNRTTGDLGVAMEDVSGNFLQASGLSAGTLQTGKNLVYSINGGGELVSNSNTINGETAGIPGLSATVMAEGTATVSVSSDTAKVKSALVDFVTEYNKVQSTISQHTASSTDAQGKVTAGVLANDSDVSEISRLLRQLVTSEVTGGTGSLRRMDDLGFSSNGTDDSLATTDIARLDELLNDGFGALQSFLNTGSTGLVQRLDTYLKKVVGDDGSLIRHSDALATQATTIDTQVADLERIVQASRQRMIDNFVAMETAQARMAQQLQFLTQRFGTA